MKFRGSRRQFPPASESAKLQFASKLFDLHDGFRPTFDYLAHVTVRGRERSLLIQECRFGLEERPVSPAFFEARQRSRFDKALFFALNRDCRIQSSIHRFFARAEGTP